jgi:transcriptional regulator with XRE-family HTH domain
MPAREAEVFGRVVKRFREQSGWTQEVLALAAGLTTHYLSDIERGVKVPSLTTVLRLAHAFDVAAGDLMVDFTPTMIRRLLRSE